MARFRVAVFKQRGNIGLVLRRIPNEFLTFEQLGLPPVIEQLIQRPRGLILVTGPTGSGKTTSLASMINWINDNMDRHIITIEDPIEYFHKHKKSLINQREIGIDVPDFPEAIRRALRMDPDIILVGEMRDLATIQAAITAAETGHIVFGTLHTNSAEGTVNRIIDVFPKEQQDQIRTQLSVAIIGILAQALLPRKPKGLVAAYEMLVVTPAISNLIRENKTYRIDSSIQTGRKHGMILLDDSLFNLWRQGLVEEEEVMDKSRKPARPAASGSRTGQEGDLRRRGRRGGGRGEVRRVNSSGVARPAVTTGRPGRRNSGRAQRVRRPGRLRGVLPSRPGRSRRAAPDSRPARGRPSDLESEPDPATSAHRPASSRRGGRDPGAPGPVTPERMVHPWRADSARSWWTWATSTRMRSGRSSRSRSGPTAS